jgi:TrwC relaxase
VPHLFAFPVPSPLDLTAAAARSASGVVTMSIHKLTAGSGYDYLTRQVAALDATEKGHFGLASYYAERGETPGVWMGSGMDGIDGLNPGDVVTAEQMRALFGAGLHPLAVERQRQLQGPELTVPDYRLVTRLGAPFKIYQPDVSPFRVEVARRIAAFNQAAGLPGDWAVPAADRARIRTEVARDSSSPSTDASRRMLGSWPPRSPNTPGPRRRRSPAMT